MHGNTDVEKERIPLNNGMRGETRISPTTSNQLVRGLDRGSRSTRRGKDEIKGSKSIGG